jgi:hypothetical protein
MSWHWFSRQRTEGIDCNELCLPADSVCYPLSEQEENGALPPGAVGKGFPITEAQGMVGNDVQPFLFPSPPMTRKLSDHGQHGTISSRYEWFLDSAWLRLKAVISSTTSRARRLNWDRQGSRARPVARLFNIRNALIFTWLCTIWWGERIVFKNSLQACRWNRWEHWVSASSVVIWTCSDASASL